MGLRGVLVVGALLAWSLWPTAGEALEDPASERPVVSEARGLTVSPSTGLVHDQVVVVRGTGWGRQTSIGATQCLQGATEIWGCGPITWALSGRDGRFRADLEVAAVLETDDGTFDCRVVACVVAVDDEIGTNRPEIVDVTFDPGGPDPVRRIATVTPDTGLVDGQEVTVTAGGIPAAPDQPGSVEMVQCRTPVVFRWADCDQGTWARASTDLAGHVDHGYAVATILHLQGGAPHDCRTGGCSLAVYAPEDTLAEGALVPLGFDPIAPVRPPPTLTVDPTVDLVDGEIVTLAGAGWPARAFVGVIPCVSGATDLDDCDDEYQEQFRADAAGHIQGRVGAATTLWLGAGNEMDCRVTACSLFAVVDEWMPSAVEVPLDFTPDGPLLRPAVEVSPSTGLHDGDMVTVSGDHARPDAYLKLIQCAADTRYYHGCDWANQDYLETPLQGRADVGLSFATTYTVHRVFRDGDGRTIDCTVVPCVLIVNGEIDPMERAARVPLGFAAVPADPIGATPTFTG